MIGNKINLRPLLKNDITVLNHWKNDETVYQYLGGGYQPVSIDQQRDWMDSMIDLTGNNRRFMITASEKPVGIVGLYDINWIHRTCEIGVYIGDVTAREKGYASEACLFMEQYAEKHLNLRKIKLKVVSDNNKAVLMWSKLGYKKVGELQKERFIKGNYHNLILMEKFIEKSGGGVLLLDKFRLSYFSMSLENRGGCVI